MRAARLLLIACADLAAASASHAQSFPPVVQAAIAAARKGCEGKTEERRGFVTTRDVNGDGRPDYVLDYGAFRCDGTADSCGSGGCTTQVFVSMPDGSYRKAYDDLARGVRFQGVRGRPAMILDLHGSACGRVGAADCRSTLYWNGERFGSANSRGRPAHRTDAAAP